MEVPPGVFNLEARAGPDKKHAARVWTADEQKEKLSNYMEIPSVHWENIRYGTHIRYISKPDKFHTGGFVLKNPFDTKTQGAAAEKRFIKLQNGFDSKAQNYAQWIVAYEDLAKMFIKPDAGVLTVKQDLDDAVAALNVNIRKLAEASKRHEAILRKFPA